MDLNSSHTRHEGVPWVHFGYGQFDLFLRVIRCCLLSFQDQDTVECWGECQQ